MAPPVLRLSDIMLTFGGTPLLDGADMSVGPHDRLCLVGRNGSGKSTFLKLAAGLIEPDEGEVFVQPGITVKYLPQEPDLSGHDTVADYVISNLGPSDDTHRALRMLTDLGLSGNENPGALSGGEARRAALAAALGTDPDVLLLDEPTNHLDLPAIQWLEDKLQARRGALVLISHDRRFLQNLGKSVVWLDLGRTFRMDKGFEHFDDWRDEMVEREAVERHKLDRKIVAETAWLHKGVTARRKRNMGRLRALQDLRRDRREQRQRAGGVAITLSEADASGKLAIDAKDISKDYEGRSIVRPFSTRILRCDRVGIIGPNGAGKTTLLNLLTGALEPDSGSVKRSKTLEMATLDQKREELSETVTLQDALTGGSGDSVTIGGQQKHVIGYMKDFLFDPAQARMTVSALSGGERGRLMLARAMTRPSNLLVLDEPTNDLDLETLDLLQEMLADYAGTVILVSHDRDFLDRVVTSVINFEGDGHWQEYAGGYADMQAQRGEMATNAKTAISSQKPKKTQGEAASAKPAKRKLSYKEKYALETLPDEIDQMERGVADIEGRLSDPELYSRDPEAFQKLSAELAALQDKLSSAEDEWLRLEALREEIDAER